MVSSVDLSSIDPGGGPWDQAWIDRKLAEIARAAGQSGQPLQQAFVGWHRRAALSAVEARSAELGGQATLGSTSRAELRRMAEQSEEHFSEAFSLYHAALDEWQDVGSKLMLRVPPETTAEEDDHYSRRRAIAFIHGKALRVAREVYVLTIHGFGWAALARWRTLHELAVCAHLIGSEDESLGARFLDHVEIGSLELAVAQRQVAQELGGADVEDAELERLQQRKLELIREHGDGFEGRWGWARPLVNGKLNFEVLEDRTPFKHLRGIYKAASTEIHASPQSVTSNARRVDGNQHITTGPSPDQLGAGMNWSLASVQAISTLLVMEGGKYGDLMDQVRVEAGARVAADCRRLLHETLQQLDEWRRIRDESSP